MAVFSDLAQLEIVSSPLWGRQEACRAAIDARKVLREGPDITRSRGPKERCLESIERCFWALNPRIRSSLVDSVFV